MITPGDQQDADSMRCCALFEPDDSVGGKRVNKAELLAIKLTISTLKILLEPY